MIPSPANEQVAIRRFIEAEIERLIGLLDVMGPDPDLEDEADAEPSLGWCAGTSGRMGTTDDREDENEHGGDIQDEPHDEEPDDEHSLGWRNPMAESDGRQW